MAKKKQKPAEDEVIVDVTAQISKAEKFIQDNQKNIVATIIGLVAGVAIYFAYTLLYMAPREKEAQAELYKAQEYFQNDSLRLALNGGAGNLGFLDIINDYSGTKAAKLSRYYAGISHLHLGEFEEAIRQLEKFNSKDEVFGPLAKGAIGDAFLELDQPKEALEYYTKAARMSKNKFVTPLFLMKAGQVAEMQGNYKLALENFKTIESDYKDSREASGIRRHIGRMEGKIANK